MKIPWSRAFCNERDTEIGGASAMPELVMHDSESVLCNDCRFELHEAALR